MSSILSRCRLSISKRGYQSRAPTAIKRVMFYSSLQAAVSNSIYSNINFKVKHVVCLEAIYRGRDVVAVLPTGYGKSMIFHLLPSLFLDKIKWNNLDFCTGRLINFFGVCTGLPCDMAVMQHSGTT